MVDASKALINKYRPGSWEELLGNFEVFGALERATKSGARPHGYLLMGPSGIGKTTTARILAKHFDADVDEIDAATNSGVEAMRALVEQSGHMSLKGDGTRMLIIDECHALTKNAWQAILKLLEEPPPYLYIALCTTEASKVPETVKTRCYEVVLRPVARRDMEDLLEYVCKEEGWEPNNDVLRLVVQAATGQPRKGLSLLQVVHDAEDVAEARRIIALNEDSDSMIELLRYLTSGKRAWEQVQPLLQRMRDEDFGEEVIIGAGRYLQTVLLDTKDSKKAEAVWLLMEALLFPAATYDRRVAFTTAIGRMLWGRV